MEFFSLLYVNIIIICSYCFFFGGGRRLRHNITYFCWFSREYVDMDVSGIFKMYLSGL